MLHAPDHAQPLRSPEAARPASAGPIAGGAPPRPPRPPQPAAAPQRGRLDAWRLLQDAAALHGDRLAVVDCGSAAAAAGNGSPSGGAGPPAHLLLTYRDLLRQSAALATTLAAHGARRGSRVGVLMRNRAEVIVAHHAAAALHAVIVNLNTGLAATELRFILSDSSTEILLAAREFSGLIAAAVADQPDSGSAAQQRQPLAAALQTVIWVGGDSTAAAAERQPVIPGLVNLSWPSELGGFGGGGGGGGGGGAEAAAAPLTTCFDLPEGADEEDAYHLYYTRCVCVCVWTDFPVLCVCIACCLVAWLG